VSAILSRRIQSITAGKYSRRQQEFKVYLHRTGKADGTLRERRMWNLLVPPSGAREGFNPHAHDGAARRSDIKLDVNFVIRDWVDFISTCKIGGLLKGIGSLAGYRSAFNDAWSQQVVDRGVARPPGMDEAVKIFFTGLAKKDAEERLTGLRKQKVGKDQLPQPAFRCVRVSAWSVSVHGPAVLGRLLTSCTPSTTLAGISAAGYSRQGPRPACSLTVSSLLRGA
jgi:hypothetical protein